MSKIKDRLKWFKSLCFIVDSELAASGAQRLIDFLHKYDSFYRDKTGINKGNDLFLLYGRNMSLCMDESVNDPLAYFGIIHAALQHEFNPWLELPLALFLEKYENIMPAIQEMPHLNLKLYISERQNHGYTFLKRDLERLLSKTRCRLTLTGDLKTWRKLGTTSMKAIMPRYHVYLSNQKGGGRIRHNSFNPCFGKWRVVVDNASDVYPCLGLVDTPLGKVGSIKENVEDLGLLNRDMLCGAKYFDLNRCGPEIPREGFYVEKTNLPAICFYHRRSLSL